jgi:hypothetical protein
MGTRNGYAPTEPHQFGEHLCTGNNGNTGIPGGLNLDILRGDCGRNHDDIGSCDVPGLMADVNHGTALRQAPGKLTDHKIRTGDTVSLIQQDRCDTAHAHSSDPDKVNLLDEFTHQ